MEDCRHGPDPRVRRHPGGRPRDAHVRRRAARRRPLPRRRLLHRHLPAHRAVAALGGAARRLRLPRRGAGDLPPGRAGRDRARVRRRGQGARAGATPTRPRWRTSTPTSTPRSPGSAERTPSIGAAGHCTGGHLAFRAAFRPQVRATACWYATGLHDGKLGKDPDAGSLARAGEISRRAVDDLGHRGSAHPGGRPRRSCAAGSSRWATRLTWREYERRARVRPRRRRALRPAGHGRGVRGHARAVPARALGGRGEQLFGRPVPDRGVRLAELLGGADEVDRDRAHLAGDLGQLRRTRARARRGGRR